MLLTEEDEFGSSCRHREDNDLGYYGVISASGLPSGQVTSFNIRPSAFKLENILFNFCEACCGTSMASIPPSAFSAGRIRETQRDMKISTLKRPGDNRSKYYDAAAELSPLKYNSKLMNSIWGFYNRYSPHNVKKVAEANGFVGELPQSSGNSSSKNEILTFPSGQLKKMWKNINIQHSN